MHRRAMVWILFVTLATAGATVGPSQQSSAGHVVVADDDALVHVFLPDRFTDARFVFAGDGAFDGDETVYLQATPSDNVAMGDVRIANHGDLGSRVVADDADHGAAVAAFSPGPLGPSDVAYYDADGGSTLDPDDTLFLDVDADGVVSVGDITLSGDGAGTVVGSDHDLFNVALDTDGIPSSQDALRFFDGDGDGRPDAGDAAFLDADADGFATVADLRLSGTDFGAFIRDYSPEATFFLQSFDFGPPRFLYIDDNSNERFDPVEPVYLSWRDSDKVEGLDIRIANTGSFAIGSQVRGADSDFWSPVTSDFGAGQSGDMDAGDVAYFDQDGDRVFTLGDTLILDIDGNEFASRDDIILSGRDMGTVIDGGHPMLNNGLIRNGLPADADAFRLFDADGDDRHSLHDRTYYDAGHAVFVTIGDVTISGRDAGWVVDAYDHEAVPVMDLDIDLSDARFTYQDRDGDGAYDVGEPVYWQPVPRDAVAAFDIRIADPVDGCLAGTQVAIHSPTIGTVVREAFGPGGAAGVDAQDIAYVDTDGDGAFTGEDVLILDVTVAGSVSEGDIALSGPGANDVVRVGHGLEGEALTSAGLPDGDAAFAVWDQDGDGRYGAADRLYYDATVPGFLTVQDVLLSRVVAPCAAVEPSDDGDDGEPVDDGLDDGNVTDGDGSDGADGGDGVDGTDGDGSSDPGQGPGSDAPGGNGTDNGTAQPSIPGPGAGLALVLVVAVALMARRRR